MITAAFILRQSFGRFAVSRSRIHQSSKLTSVGDLCTRSSVQAAWTSSHTFYANGHFVRFGFAICPLLQSFLALAPRWRICAWALACVLTRSIWARRSTRSLWIAPRTLITYTKYVQNFRQNFTRPWPPCMSLWEGPTSKKTFFFCLGTKSRLFWLSL